MESKNGKIIVMADQSRSEHSAPKVYALVYAKVYANGKATRTSARMEIKIDQICDNIKEVYRESTVDGRRSIKRSIDHLSGESDTLVELSVIIQNPPGPVPAALYQD
ncbi:hypothetical protein B0H17DRAFT_1142479 [Mycena rosella]|uniref:Uncharacterized protein n=1 Tax=Mycena rosella TaxID=1033263 RepID=A0AAD7G525_MYCRO|nr:hypothetical protein B0H17DRAFT_1142479 [Mycena rosella]